METTRLPLVHLTRSSTSGKVDPALLVLLHGNGSNEHALFDRVQQFDPRFVIVSPRGPRVLAPGSYAWMHIAATATGYIYSPQEVEAAFEAVLRFLNEVQTACHARPDRTYVMGFSQGAQFAGAVGLVRPESVAGIVVIGAWVPDEAFALAAPPERLPQLSCFIAHGTYDPIVPVSQMRLTRDRIAELLPAVTYREYPVGHELSDDCLHDVSTWLTQHLDGTE